MSIPADSGRLVPPSCSHSASSVSGVGVTMKVRSGIAILKVAMLLRDGVQASVCLVNTHDFTTAAFKLVKLGIRDGACSCLKLVALECRPRNGPTVLKQTKPEGL